MSQDIIHYNKPLGFKIWEHTSAGMAKAHTHGDIEINYFSSGYLEYLHGGRIYPLNSGEYNIFWGGIPHQSFKNSSKIHGIWLTIPVEWLIHWKLSGDFLNRLLSGEVISDEKPCTQDWQQLSNWTKEFESKDLSFTKIIILELEARLRRIALNSTSEKINKPLTHNFANKQFLKTLDFISSNFLKIKNIDALAKKVDLHPKYLMQMFKKTSGINLWHYILRLRIAHAQRLLLTTDMKVLDIAYESGFDSPSAFYRSFAKYSSNKSPKVYKKESFN